jgi:hypothetical protein
MPWPKPIRRVSLTDEQLALAHKVAHQHTAPHRQVLRARLTLLLAEEPDVPHPEAARRVGLDYNTVYKWRRRWAEDGWSLDDAPRSGRPPSFSPRGDGDGQSAGL